MTTARFENSYAELPEQFFTAQLAQAAPKPDVIATNDALADFLNLPSGYLQTTEGLELISGKAFPKSAKPIAQAYAGHQFGGFSPQLGDGRALLIGELLARDGKRYDVQLKGSGQTPYSRRGDGKSALGPVIREYLISEAMHCLAVPTTRALAAIRTGEEVYRNTPEPGGMFTRVAESHIRVGTFQYFLARNDIEALIALKDYAIHRHHPEVADHDTPVKAFYESVCQAQAKLIARWMSLGFIHGVMNTDNCTISGQTIDYGPCAFMDQFHAMKVFSSIDTQGRYAWARQPQIGHWNMTRFGEALLPIWGKDEEEAIEEIKEGLDIYTQTVNAEMARRFADKLGLTPSPETDTFIQNTLGFMQAEKLDFSRFFASLRVDGEAMRGWSETPQGSAWFDDWTRRLDREDKTHSENRRAQSNPIYIPRNHQVARAIAAGEAGDDAPFHALLKVLQKPFERQEGQDDYEAEPSAEEEVTQTFCGT